MSNNNDSKQVNPRISKEAFDILELAAKQKDLAPTTYMAKILEDHARYYELKVQAFIIDKDILTKICSDDDKVDEMALGQSERKFAEWQVSPDPVSFEYFVKRFKAWHDLNNIQYKIAMVEDSIIFTVNHGIGERWSRFQCMMNINLLEKLDETVLSKKIERLIFSIEIKNIHQDFTI